MHTGAQVVATAGDPALREVTIAGRRRRTTRPSTADVLAVSGGWNPTVQLARGIGDRRSPTTTPRRASSTTAPARRGCSVVGRRRRRRARGVPDLGGRRRRRRREVRRAPARPDRRRRRGRRGGRADQRRAREACDLHRHHDRPGTHERRPDRRDREPAARLGAGRAGTDQRAAAVHADPVLARSPASTAADPARPDPRHPDPRLARGRTAPSTRTSASGSARATSRRAARTWTPRSRASAERCAPGVGLLDASTLGKIDVVRPRRRRVPRSDVHEPHVEPGRRLDPVRTDARASTGWCSTTASRCAWPTTATS